MHPPDFAEAPESRMDPGAIIADKDAHTLEPSAPKPSCAMSKAGLKHRPSLCADEIVIDPCQFSADPDQFTMNWKRGDNNMSESFFRVTGKNWNYGLSLRTAACLTALAFAPFGALAEEDLIGADEYRVSCLACHGVGGRGDGPMAEFLSVTPADLTVISKNNEGVFPLLEVFRVVDGRTVVGSHGVRNTEGWEMPVWGARYKEQAGEKYGEYGSETAVRARILELVFYIQSVQQ